MVSLPVPINVIQRFSYLFPQWTNGTPFNYQDGQTHAKLLEALVQYLDDILTPYVDTQMQAVIDAWKESTESLIELVLNNSIELQDPVLSAILADEESETRILIQTLLEGVIVEKPDDPGVFAILTPTPEPGTGDGDNVIPDPDNPCFWIVE